MHRLLLSLALSALALFASSLPALAQESSTKDKSPLRVLLVSHDPQAPQVLPVDMTWRTLELYKERAASWKALLNEHFAQVTLVYGPAYDVTMSDAVDVTVFDARPKAISDVGMVTNPVRGEESHKRASYLPRSFTRPALMISENSPLIGEPLGLKLDWL